MLSWLAPLLGPRARDLRARARAFPRRQVGRRVRAALLARLGQPLWSFRRGETEYAISALPIGGYVRMASQEDEQASALEGGPELKSDGAPVERSKHWDEHSMIPHGPLPIPKDRWFESKPLYRGW
jgi:membrane-associated protease RseP (regulator of RpoE activity)